ncbi:MAG: homocysteine S-methyltransferase [Actinomycetota bacterium]
MGVRERFAGSVVLDGGLATELERRGADLHDRLWSARLLIEDPDLIRRVHLAYFEAGADVAISASYQASFEGFAARGIDRGGAADLLARSVRLAREAADESGPDRLVAASVGPYGAMRADGSEYSGRYGVSVERLIEFHRPRLEVLLAAEPDLLAVETIPSIEEAEAIVIVLDRYPEALAWIAFSCRDDERLSDGTPLAEAAALVASSDRVVGVGVNCTPAAFVPGLLRSAEVTKPMLAYPNLGSDWDPAAKAWRAVGPRPDLGAEADRWREAGARIVGGCCGTEPRDIAAIAAGR